MKTCKCGATVASNAKFCPQCGHRFIGGFVKALAWCFGLFIVIELASGMIHHGWALLLPQQNLSVQKRLLDLPEIALRKRAYVEQIVGKPLRYQKRSGLGEIGDMAVYSWGELLYAKGHLVGLIRNSAPKPYQAALAEIGLPDLSPYVRPNDGNMIWADRPFRSGIHCCGGLAVHDAFLTGDYSEFHVYLLDIDDPVTWTDDECLMWLNFSGSPIPEAAMQRGDILDWPVHHDNTPQACKSGPR